MSQKSDVVEKIRDLLKRDSRYRPEAYDFIRQALEFQGQRAQVRGHLSGRDLLEGFRDLAIQRYGPLARMVLEQWGIRRTEDVGEVVFNMVDVGLLSKTETDRREDFAGVYDFRDVFVDRYPWHARGSVDLSKGSADRGGEEA
jgi:uncharacterized repeat protein (TIGR04138 family)